MLLLCRIISNSELLQINPSSAWLKFASKGYFRHKTCELAWGLQNPKPFSSPHHYRPSILNSLYIYLLTTVPCNTLSGLCSLPQKGVSKLEKARATQDNLPSESTWKETMKSCVLILIASLHSCLTSKSRLAAQKFFYKIREWSYISVLLTSTYY